MPFPECCPAERSRILVSSPLHRRTDLTWSDIRDLWDHREGEDDNILLRMIIFHREGDDANIFMESLAFLPTHSLQSSSSNELPVSCMKKCITKI